MAVAEFGSIMGEIGTDENFGDKTGGDRPREHCILENQDLIPGSNIFQHIFFSFVEIIGQWWWRWSWGQVSQVIICKTEEKITQVSQFKANINTFLMSVKKF